MSAGAIYMDGCFYPYISNDNGIELMDMPKDTEDEAVLEARTVEATTDLYEAVIIARPKVLSIRASSYKEATKKALARADELSSSVAQYELDVVRKV